jgi:predicted small lipoprotein YifL
MKKLFVPIVALATVFVFTSCGSDITINIPSEDLTIDLGDREAALKDVTAKGKKDIPKEDITIVGLEWVGDATLTYTAKEESATETKTREATVKADKLFGNYRVEETDLVNGGTDTYNVTVVSSAKGVTKLVISNFLDLNFSATFAGDGKSTTLTMEPMELSSGVATVTGTAKYHAQGTGYEIFDCQYEVTYSDGSDKDKFSAKLEKR